MKKLKTYTYRMILCKKEQMRISSTFPEVFHQCMRTDVQKKPRKEREQAGNRVDRHGDGRGTRSEEDLSKWTLALSVVL